MTTTTAPVSAESRPALPSTGWHRPLLVLAAAMAVLIVACVIGYAVDPRQLLGVSVWEKPLKFAISTAVYAITWSWLLAQLQRGRRLGWWAGTIVAVLLVIELVIIVGLAIVGETSHFNVSTPLHIALWSIMAGSIGTLWVATFVASVLLFRNRLGDAARGLAIRAGAIIALVGMALAFLMTGPTAAQLDDFQGIAGAHTVGVADGGPGLPVLGWSTVAGDLRIPHFVGMHALQVLPLLLIALELLARRVAVLRDVAVRWRLVAIATAAYAATLALLTAQALRGQSIVQPDPVTLAVAAVIVVASLGAVLAVLVAAHRPAAVVAAS